MVVVGQVFAQEVIEVRVESAACHLGGVLCLEGAGGGVAWVGEERLLVEGALGVEALERLPGHDYLAAYLKEVGPSRPAEGEGYRLDGLDVGGDVVAVGAVAAGDGAQQAPVLVDERDARAVEFQLTHHHGLFAGEIFLDSVNPLVYLLHRICVGQRQHGVDVRHLLEAFGEVRPHTARGRQRVVHFGVAALKVLELVHEHVKLQVGDFGPVEHVVAVVVAVKLVAELFYSLLFVHIGGIEEVSLINKVNVLRVLRFSVLSACLWLCRRLLSRGGSGRTG